MVVGTEWVQFCNVGEFVTITPETGMIKIQMSEMMPETELFNGAPLCSSRFDSLTYTAAPANIWGRSNSGEVDVTVNLSTDTNGAS